ncbi:MAG: hypothetical protein FJ405_02905, partial [Verrucomicrobia bacterium]|nr:hypothetical protein [Verrucomicrobiota bacterium]
MADPCCPFVFGGSRRSAWMGCLLLALPLLRELSGQVLISEFMSANDRTLTDEDGDSPDWIELHNPSTSSVSIEHWSLSDNPRAPENQRWTFPATNIPPNGFLLVFASGKDRRVPGAPLHCSFRLSQAGEPLALYDSAGRLVDGLFTRWIQPQLTDVSSGRPIQSREFDLTPAEIEMEIMAPVDASWDSTWHTLERSPQGWLQGPGPVGYDTRPASLFSFHNWIKTELPPGLFGRPPAAYVRIPFQWDASEIPESLILRILFPDGFVAYLNGFEVAAWNRPETLAWTSRATRAREPLEVGRVSQFPLPPESTRYLRPGLNWLFIHAFAASNVPRYWMVHAGLIARDTMIAEGQPVYFTAPTPGALNRRGNEAIGPVLSESARPPPTVRSNEPVQCAVRVTPAFSPVRKVELRYRVMFESERSVEMKPGKAPGWFFASIPSDVAKAGEMIRWRYVAEDQRGVSNHWPSFDDPQASPQYQGTIVDPGVDPGLPVIRCFVPPSDLVAASSLIGARASVHYAGEFYDNVYIRIRGQVSLGWPKPNFKIDFNPGFRFALHPQHERVEELNLNSNWSDKSNLRQILSWELFRRAGSPHCLSFPVRMDMNNAFYSLRIVVEHPDDRYLARNGLDPEGSLYKMDNALNTTSLADKRYPRDQDYRELEEFVASISEINPRQTDFLYDHVDIPSVLNYLAVNVLIHDNDSVGKNYFLHRDSSGARLWRVLPWDKDLTFGHNHRSRVGLSDDIWADFDRTNTFGSDRALSSPSHPLFGDRTHQKDSGEWNRLTDAFHRNLGLQEMFLRRLRTLMDSLLQAPEVPMHERLIEGLIDQRLREMRLDAALDRSKWGDPAYGSSRDMGTDLRFLQADYLEKRRIHLFRTHHVTNAPLYLKSARIPEKQTAGLMLEIRSIDRRPFSGRSSEEYIEIFNPNPESVDVSGWQVTGLVSHVFQPGTVIPLLGSLFLVADAKAFRERVLPPAGGQRRLIQGNWRGGIGRQAGSIEIREGNRRAAELVLPDVSSDLQKNLRIARIMYAPSSLTDPQESLEYVELRNVGSTELDLSGVGFVQGIQFRFPTPGPKLPAADLAVPMSRSVFVVRDPVAFARRFGTSLKVWGPFAGRLDNAGERLTIATEEGSEIHTVDYSPTVFPITVGFGFPFIVPESVRTLPQHTPEHLQPGRWEGRTESIEPGLPAPAHSADVLISEVIFGQVPGSDLIELSGPPGTSVGGWLITDDPLHPGRYRLPSPSSIPANGLLVLRASDLERLEPGSPGFSLDPAGAPLLLVSSDPDGHLTGWLHRIDHPGGQPGTSFSHERLERTRDSRLWMTRATPGAPNDLRQLSPLRISEVHFHTLQGSDAREDESLEFVEIHNVTDQTIESHPPWAGSLPVAVEGDVRFDFPPGFRFPPHGWVVLVGFDPVLDPWKEAEFRHRFRVPASALIRGPFRGQLGNSSGTLELRMPWRVPTGSTWLISDAMRFSMAHHDTALAGGMGASLNLMSEQPNSFRSARPSPGWGPVFGVGPSILIHPASRTVTAYSTSPLTVLAEPDESVVFQWMRNGRPIPGANSETLTFHDSSPAEAGAYQVMLMNHAGAVLSRSAEIKFHQPPVILTHPQLPLAVGTSNYVLRVFAIGTEPLSYRWEWNNRPLPGANLPTLTISNMNRSHEGTYEAVVSDAFGSARSARVTVSVVELPQLISTPESQMVNVGD